MAGNIAPSPSLPLSRSVTNDTALSIARRRMLRGKTGSRQAQRRVDARKEAEQRLLLVRCSRAGANASRRPQEKLVNSYALGIARRRLQRLEHQKRHHHSPCPVGYFGEMERKPPR